MIKRIAYCCLALSLLIAACLVLLMATQSGLVLIQKGVNRFGGQVVSIGRVEGSLFASGTLTDLRLLVAGNKISVDRLQYSWRPIEFFKAGLHIDELVLTGVRIAVVDQTEQDKTDKVVPNDRPGQDKLELPERLLPFPVLLDDCTINKLSLTDSAGLELLAINKLQTSLAGDADRLTIKKFFFEGPEMGLALKGTIAVQGPWTLAASGKWHLAGYGFHAMAGTFSASGRLENPHLELSIHSPGTIRVKGDLVNLLHEPHWTAKLEAQGVDLSTLIDYCPKIELAQVTGDLHGDFQNYRGLVEADGSWDKLVGMHLAADIDGNGLGIDFKSLRIDGADSSARADGAKISWRDIFAWQGRFHFDNVDPSVITEELQGRISTEFASVGDVQDLGVVATFDIFSLNGILHDHQVSAAGKVYLRETAVQTDGLTLRSGEVAGKAFVEHGLFSWAEEPYWSVKMHLDHFDPSWLYGEFPGSVNGEFESRGRLAKTGLEGSIKIKEISGNLRGNRLSGGGELKIDSAGLQTSGLILTSGPSRLEINGRAGDGLALDFKLASPDIGTIYPDTRGEIHVLGSLKGKITAPQLEVELKGKRLTYLEDSLDQLQASLKASLQKSGKLEGALTLGKINVAGYPVEKIAVQLEGSTSEQHLAVEAAGPLGQLRLKAFGSYNESWQGELTDVRLKSADYGDWQQLGKVSVTAGRQGANLQSLCLSDSESKVCLGGEVQLAKQLSWAVNGNLSGVPLNWLYHLNIIGVPLNGTIQADIAARGDDHRLISAKAEARVAEADLLLNTGEAGQTALHFENSALTLNLANSQLQASCDIQMKNGSQLVLDASVAGAGDYATQLNTLPLNGRLDVRAFDLSMLGAFTGYGVEPSGRVTNAFSLAGTLGQPRIYGDVKIRDGGIDLPYQGITLENIALSIEAAEEAVKITGKAGSGPGQVTAAGTLHYGTAGINGVLHIKGENFLLVNLPEYALRVNPDVQLVLGNDKGRIQGTIVVPYGLIAPEEMSDSISASDDVILVNDNGEEPVRKWPFDLDLKVVLGDDVHVDGYGLTGKVGGELKVITTSDYSLSARGELDLIDGNFSIYGRTLNIERGRMLFTGGPIDNPGIDVRAQMKVSDEEAKGTGYTVGMDISGLVQNLQYHLFSDPYMDDTEILSLMMVGHSLANSTASEGSLLEAAAVTLGLKGSAKFVQGIGSFLRLDDLHFEGSSSKEDVSLVVGKRLTKDLYIGYDINMFSQLGQFRVRYDLTRGFSVETRSSSESTGADLLYTFER